MVGVDDEVSVVPQHHHLFALKARTPEVYSSAGRFPEHSDETCRENGQLSLTTEAFRLQILLLIVCFAHNIPLSSAVPC